MPTEHTSGRGLLLVGTDTGVGKTTLAVGLLRLGHRRGFRIVPFKPVETGCSPHALDARRLWEAASIPALTPDEVAPFRFAPPVAPAVAARLAGTALSPTTLFAARPLAASGNALLVESAGGLLTPYSPGCTSATLATLFDIDVLLVAANRLGTINHTALALGELRRLSLRLAGLVLVDLLPTRTLDQDHNAAEISALTGVSPLGTLRYCARTDADTLADAVSADLALDRLFGGALL